MFMAINEILNAYYIFCDWIDFYEFGSVYKKIYF